MNDKQCFCTTKSTLKPKSILQQQLSDQGYILLENYINTDTPILVKRIICGHTFKVRIAAILKDKYYCPECHLHKGEEVIQNFLKSNNINFISQYKIFYL